MGNTRICFTDKDGNGVIDITGNAETNEILEESQYYAFGMSMEGAWMKNLGRENDYLYNGKELDTDFGLNWYHYGARFYDPAIARWNAVDPLGELTPNWTPFRYGFNNPISFIDPDGRMEATDGYGAVSQTSGSYQSSAPDGDFYDKKGNYLGTDGVNDGKTYIAHKKKDVKAVKSNHSSGGTTSVSSLTDPVLLPTKAVRNVMKDMVDRTKLPNDTRTDNFKGDDNTGGFHEEGGYFSETNIVESKPGPKTSPDKADATLNQFIPANPKDRGNVSLALGTVHTHPNGSTATHGFIQTVSNPGDLKALGAAKSAKWVQSNG